MEREVIDEYLEEHVSSISEELNALEDFTRRNVLRGKMISGRNQGKFLSFLSKLIRPSRILEIGTFTGYSALCLAEGLVQDGKLLSLEVNEELEPIHNKFLSHNQNISILYGDGLELLREMKSDGFDLIFIDADKKSYPSYFKTCIELLNPGGLLLADNVLWYGKVADSKIIDKETEALKEYNRLVLEHPLLESFILPIRDGISVAQKKASS